MSQHGLFSDIVTQLFGQPSVYFQLARFLFILLVGVIATRSLLVPFGRNILGRGTKDKRTKHALGNFFGVLGFFMTIVVALQAADFGNLITMISVVAAGATAALGWGMRDQVANLVSGIFLHVDPIFVRGDYIDVKDVQGEVREVRLMETQLKDPLGQKMIIPNSALTTNPVRNMSRGNKTQDTVTLTVKPDRLGDVVKTLQTLADEADEVLARPKPRVMHNDITGDGITTTLSYHLKDNTDVAAVKSLIIERFVDSGIAADAIGTNSDDTKESADSSGN